MRIHIVTADVQDMTKAQQTANQLNKEDRNGRT